MVGDKCVVVHSSTHLLLDKNLVNSYTRNNDYDQVSDCSCEEQNERTVGVGLCHMVPSHLDMF
jgi:hypothetical protein